MDLDTPIRAAAPAGVVPAGADTTAEKLADLGRRTAQAERNGGPAALARQRARRRGTARERIAGLLDPGSFVELDALSTHRSTAAGMAASHPLGDGVVTGTGTVDGRPVVVYSQDATVFGGAIGEVGGEKILKAMDLAVRVGCPIVGINDGGGARITEGVASLRSYGEIFMRNVSCSGVVPQLSLIMGPCAGGAVYSPALTDFTVMVDRTSHMFITGPGIVKAATGQEIDLEALGGGRLHNTRTGVAHHLAADESDALAYVRRLLGHLPGNNKELPPVVAGPPPPAGEIGDGLTPADLELDTLIPDSPRRAYDVREILSRVLDGGGFLEVQPLFAANIVCGFGRVDGRSVGVVANQPARFAGCLNIDASEKAARFVRTCDAFNVPVLTFVDVPGFLPGTDQEWNGLIRRGAKLIYAYAEATVPKITVITRKAYGGAYGVMGSKHLGADVNLAWPTAQIAVTGASGAVSVLYRRELSGLDGEERAARRAQLEREYESLATPYQAADRGYVDAVIPPSHTRGHLVRALRLLARKRVVAPDRKHGNIPL
ncbi:propionyl-CoA carboxylase beta chain [Micromonospora haikouensis]|uniref:Propionyl-CoA carboxylase beta chain n=1 Tax=Micromonospora haikouensis TaxID=686309 RepID=A0A1C4XKJ9_9ACTN|nr:acyl-CoA carboxylase subunit beta [Micromonospora haikouensis]SCF08977.1 propionyl-CoA carboxylase beta chain [Micromonospora haikouensis]